MLIDENRSGKQRKEMAMKSSRTRIEDVARASGLSRSTVDRVLNKRPGVRLETVRKVEETLRELGYAPTALAQHTGSLTQQIEVFLSEGTNPFFLNLRQGFEQTLTSLTGRSPRVIMRSFDPYEPATVVRALERIAPETDAVITVGVDNHDVTRAINAIHDRGIPVVTIVSDTPSSRRKTYVGQDNFAAGRTAGRLMSRMLPSGESKVGLLLGHLEFRHLLDRRSGFQQVLGITRPDVTLHETRPYGTDPTKACEVVAELLKKTPDMRGLYLAGGGQPTLIEALRSLAQPDLVVIGHEVNELSRAALLDNTFAALLSHDVNELARKSLETVISGKFDGPVHCTINVLLPDNLPP